LAQTTASASLNVGFLTILHEPNGYLGGYLVTNQWGRPLEFRLSTAVQPNRVQQILYGGTLEPYICSDLIGKTLIEKTSLGVQLVLTDTDKALDLRQHLQIPVAWVAARTATAGQSNLENHPCRCSLAAGRDIVLCHGRYTADIPPIREMLTRLEGTLELSEPFARIREAMGEARKMGVTQRMTG
jgi:hypothetical protein